MKDLLITILFLIICIVFGILFYTNEQLMNKIKLVEHRIEKCETAIIQGTKIDSVQFQIMNEIVNKIDRNERKNSLFTQYLR